MAESSCALSGLSALAIVLARGKGFSDMTLFKRAAIAAAAIAAAAAIHPANAIADLARTGWTTDQALMLSCEDGGQYPLRPRAVSVAGEVVTGTLVVSPRRQIHMRLIPMGNGYRYAGRGIWFDGIAGNAMLFNGPSRSVACSVVNAS